MAVKCLDFGKNFSVVPAVDEDLTVGLYRLGQKSQGSLMENFFIRCVVLLVLIFCHFINYNTEADFDSKLKIAATMGLEPTIFCSVGRRLIH